MAKAKMIPKAGITRRRPDGSKRRYSCGGKIKRGK